MKQNANVSVHCIRGELSYRWASNFVAPEKAELHYKHNAPKAVFIV